MAKLFKGDQLEKQFYGSARQVFTDLKLALADWFEKAYNGQKFGGVLFDENVSPLSQRVPREIFIRSFNAIFEQWRYGGNFESYIYIFGRIFGDAAITFERIAPAHLKINIATEELQLFNWIVRTAADDNLTFNDGADRAVFQEHERITDFNELRGILQSLNPAGIFLEVNFSIGAN